MHDNRPPRPARQNNETAYLREQSMVSPSTVASPARQRAEGMDALKHVIRQDNMISLLLLRLEVYLPCSAGRILDRYHVKTFVFFSVICHR